MAVVAVASAKGSPGVTSLAVALGAVWPRACLVADCDPAGGDVALRYGAGEEVPLDPGTGLLSLAAAARRGAATDLGEHVQHLSGGLPVLVGTANSDQAGSLVGSWPHVARALAHARDVDVVVDCGRFVTGAAHQPLLEQADAVVLVVRPAVEQVAHLRERLRSLQDVLGVGRPGGVPTGVVVVAPERDRQSGPSVERLLASSGLPVPVLGTVVEDLRGVRAIEHRRSHAGRSAFVRSVRGLVPVLDRVVVERTGVVA